MTYSNIVSTLAFGVSAGAFLLSFANYRRDRPKIKVASAFVAGHDEFEPHMIVTVTNHGRRAIFLRTLAGADVDGRESGELIGDSAGGVRVDEQGRWERKIYVEDMIYRDFFSGEATLYVRMWLVDSLGGTYEIPRSSEHLKRLRP